MPLDRRLPRALLLTALCLIPFSVAIAAYTGRSAQQVGTQGVVLGYRNDTGTGAAYRSTLAYVDTAGDVTAAGLGDLPLILCGGYSQVSASCLSGITTGVYTLRCVRLRPNAAGTALVGTDYTDASSSAQASYTEGSRYLCNRVTFDTDGAAKVVILLAAINHVSVADMATVDISAAVN
jgi:hypothetical protein